MYTEKELDRIRHMERLFDEVSAAHAQGKVCAALEPAIRELTAYMDGGQWIRDYAADGRGALPADLKRGVLSEDGLYNLLTELEEKDGNAD